MRKKLLITGGTGLIGSHLIESLSEEKEYDIIVIGRSVNSKWNNKRISAFKLDFTKEWDENCLPKDLFAIIHLSQSENFRHFPEKAKDVFYTNTLSTLKLINHAVKTKVSHFIFASSGGIYGNSDEGFKEEKEIVYDKDMGFYLATKHCSEVILENYMSLLNVILLRFFFVYGKGQRKDMLIPRLLNFVQNEQSIALQGSNGIKINPIHASDAAEAIKAALFLNESNKINVGGSEILTMRQIGEIIGEITGGIPHFIIDEEKKPKHLIGDITKMSRLLLSPKIVFKEGIKTLL